MADGLGDTFSIIPYLLRPKSRGRVLLKSLDPDENPKVILNWLKERIDVDKLIEGKLVINYRNFFTKRHVFGTTNFIFLVFTKIQFSNSSTLSCLFENYIFVFHARLHTVPICSLPLITLSKLRLPSHFKVF